ncbi:MAG TPA: XrtA/PEP-CTERM system TPR-repeat protein PrsT [Stellaceae bacterium]|nr:XrtA/PEP-CTERM system TPR-repeat protein PrsT [Stellaceae bacterium]
MIARLGPLFCAALLIASPARDAAAADPKRAESYLADAAKSLQSNDLKGAAIKLRNAVQADQDNGKARYELGVVLLQLGEFNAAEAQLRAALAHNYDGDKVAVPLAETLVRLEKNQELLDEVPPGQRPPEIEASVRAARGYALLNLHRIEEARQSFEEAVSMTAKPAWAQFGLARALGFSGDAAQAVAMLKKALANDPQLVDGWIFLGQLERALGDNAAAREAFDKALALSPGNPAALLDRAALLIAMDELAPADADIAAVLKANAQDPLGNYLQALAHAKRQNFRAAEISLQRMKAGLFTYPPAMYLLAVVNLQQDQLAQAEENITRFLTRMPNDEAGKALLGTILLRRNNLPRAIAFLKDAVGADAKSVRLLGLLADAYARNNEKDAASAILDRIVALGPQDAELKTQLAAQRLRLGQSAEAVADLEAAAALAAQSVQPGLLLILTYIDAGKLAEAREAAETMRARRPKDPLVENLLGAIALSAGNAAEARPHFEAALKLQPDFLPAQTNLGQLLLGERKFAEARGIFDAVLKGDAANQTALLAEAELSLAEGKKEDAVRWLEKARSGDANALEPRLRLVEAYIGLAAPGRAAAVAGELEKIAPDEPRAVAAIGAARLANNEIPAAIAAFDRLVKLTPEVSAAHLQRARAYYAAGDADTARVALERAAALDPGDAALAQLLIRLAIETYAAEPELAHLKELAAAKSDDPAYDLLAATFAQGIGKMGDAEAAFAAGLAKRPGDPALVTRLAQIEALRNPAKAAATLADWLQYHPDVPTVRLVLADLLFGLQRYDEATAGYEAVLAAEPANLAATNNLAWLYALKKDARAVGTAEAAYRLAPDNQAVADTLGWILVESGENARGLAVLEKAAALPDAPLELRYHFAVALKNAGRIREARRTLEALFAEERKFDGREDAKTLLRAIGGF